MEENGKSLNHRVKDNIYSDFSKFLVYRHNPVPYKRKFAYAGPPGVAYAAQAEGAFMSTFAPMQLDAVNRVADEPVQPPRVRTEFPETWLWESLDVQKYGEFLRFLPDASAHHTLIPPFI